MATSLRSCSSRSTMCKTYPILIFWLQILLSNIPISRCNALDCLEEGNWITDDGSNSNLVSPGRVFELGFFTPEGGGPSDRFLGVWYHQDSNLNSVVWVANRDKSLLGYNGSLIVQKKHAQLIDAKNTKVWSSADASASEQVHDTSDSAPSANNSNASFPNEIVRIRFVQKSQGVVFPKKHPPKVSGKNTSTGVNTTQLCLRDDGNLIIKDRSVSEPPMWQSFEDPTDTFLPGMSTMSGYASLNLTSWHARSDPTEGDFTLLLQPGAYNMLTISKRGSLHYLDSSVTLFETIPQEVSDFLIIPRNSTNTSRLVMNYTGQIQYWQRRDGQKSWSLVWWEPKDRCSLDNFCGNFGICNGNNRQPCKCLPGFKPSAQWNLGHTSAGCSPKSADPADRISSSNDVFIQLPMMNVGNTTCKASYDENCPAQCLKDVNCMAYYYGTDDCSGIRSSIRKRCLTWTDLNNLQDEYSDGITLFVRTTNSDLELSPRSDCSPCGAYNIPYPLSTAANCGDPSYFHFRCNNTTGQVYFFTPLGSSKVTLIDPDKQIFYIQVTNASNCNSINSFIFPPNISWPFDVKNCNVVNDQPLIDAKQPFIEVEMGWRPPPEIACKTDSDCRYINHTSCKTKDSKTRCFCSSKYQWDGFKLKCTRDNSWLKIVVSSVAGVLATILVCFLLSTYCIWTRRISRRKKQDLVDIKDDDAEEIDVPFFNWGSIEAATNNFSDANKLGAGGFGSVYMGKLPDGKDIAVKRLSTVSAQGNEEFRNEVVLIAKLQHRNLVRLLGYCVKVEEKILVYEFMPNGSLESCLFDQSLSEILDWEKRFGIIFGIARGLLYLHQDSRLRIIHRDLKPSNVLLDEDLNPKISDFGIARIVAGKETEASTRRVVGTYGYMSPEYAYEGLFSVKSDVFSFGVVVLETVSSRNSRTFMAEHNLSLLGHAWRLWTEDRGMELLDQRLKDACNPSEVLNCIHVGLLCVQEDAADRPTMSTVVLMLSSENAGLPSPKQPAFSTRRLTHETGSSSSAVDSSINDVTLTLTDVGR